MGDVALGRRVLRRLEAIVFGGELRRRTLMYLLDRYFESLHRRQWRWGELPHFYDHRHGAWGLLTGTVQPWGWTRAFYAGELMRPRDIVLDIGCGDGFFDSRFFAPRVAHIDAVDIDPSAIAHASRFSAAPNVAYHLSDAVSEPFPRPEYDVVVWDGALGHFPPATLDGLIRKIARAVGDGVFCGSESLGIEGSDHLQFFADEATVARLFTSHFVQVKTATLSYPLGDGIRVEVFWRCSQDPNRLLAWR